MRLAPLLVALVLAWVPAVRAAPPLSVAEAQARLKEGRLDEIYLDWAALDRGAHPEGDAAVAAVLVDASKAALAKKDAPLAFGLAEKARALSPGTLPACFAFADAALALEQRGAAAEALDAALRAAPRDGEALYRRGALAELEGDEERAVQLYRAVPKGHARRAAAREGVRRLRAALAERARRLRETRRIEKNLRRKQEQAARTPSETVGFAGAGVAGVEEDIGLAGMAARKSDHFRIVYSRGGRDFAQKARFEGKVLSMFEEAWRKVGRTLGYRPDRVFDVVLYTKDEFALHFGGQFGSGVLGFYAGKIRMNRAESLDEAFFATVVHEYTHAALDALAEGRGGAVATWFNEGLADYIEWEVAKGGERSFEGSVVLKGPRRQATRLTLAQLEHTSFARLGGAAGLAYLKAHAAVGVLADEGSGMRRIREVIEAVAGGRDFRAALAEAFGASLVEGLEAEANARLRR